MINDINDIGEIDERLAAWMMSYEQGGAQDETIADAADLEDQVPAEVLPQLSRVKSCLNRLAELRESLSFPDLPPVAFGGSRCTLDDVRRVAQFEILETLGVGGFGIVYRAWDPLTQREVALKVPRPEALASAEMQRRFEQEARAVAKLDHPNIVPVLEAGTDGQVPYIASVYYHGVTLAAWLKEQTRPISPRSAAELIARLADALNHAHLRGVLHRDIKPSNVLLVPADVATSPTMLARLPLADYVPKVTDFGLAKLAEGDNDQTRTGIMLGTLLYMSPEQAEGRVRDIAEPSDVYSLGAVLYELLTRRPPLCGDNDRGTLHQILMQEPVPPRREAAAIPRDLDAICLKCLEKQPSARYATARELAGDLDRFLSGQPTKVRPLGPVRRLTRWARRRPVVAALATMLCAALLTILGGSFVYNNRLRHSLAEASAQRAVAEQAVEDTKLTLYAADMQRAQQAWRHHHIAQVAAFLAAHDPKPGEQDRREFSWYYLRGLCNQELAVLEGHEGDVFSVAASPDGNLWASGGKDATVRLWDAATRKSVAVLRGHSDEVTEVVFSPSGELLASASEDGTIRMWTINGDGEPRTIAAHTDHVLCLAFSPDGKLLASGGRDNAVRVWNASTLALFAELKRREERITGVAFSHSGKVLVAVDADDAMHAWNTEDWQFKDDWVVFKEQHFALASSPREDLIACAGRHRTVPLRTVEGELPSESGVLPEGHLEWIQALAFSPIERVIASADKAGVIQLWNIDTQQKHVVLGHLDQVWSLAWSPDGKVLASGGGNGLIRLWDSSTRPDASAVYPLLPRKVQKVGYSSDGKLLVASTEESSTTWFDVERREVLETSDRGHDLFDTLTLSRHGGFIATYVANRGIGVAGLQGEEPSFIANQAGFQPDHAAALSCDGRRLAWDNGAQSVTISDKDSNEQATFDCDSSIKSMTFSPDSVHLAIAAERGLLVWNCSTRKLSLELPMAHSVVFSPDGSLLVAQRGADLCIYDASTGQLQQRFVNRPIRLRRMALSPDNETLAIVSGTDNHVTLLDVRSGQELLNLQVEARELCDVIFSPQGDRLAVGGADEDGKGRIWEWAIER
ncbi:MAG: protein kinase [Pirellulales bacterium]